MTTVDETDFHRLSYDSKTGVFVWKISLSNRAKNGSTAGTVNKRNGYRYIKIGGKLVLAHRLAWYVTNGFWPKNDIDHINGIRDDNRIFNLREATRSQNLGNAKLHKDSTSGFKGVTFVNDKWVAQSRGKYMGSFATPEEAHEAYVKAANDHYGEFARSA